MELIERSIELIDANIFYCLIPMILTLYLVQLIFKDRFKTKKALNLIRWFVIVYTLVSATVTFLSVDTYLFIDRATGPYLIAYWVMLFSSIILPLTLLIKKLAKRYFYLIFVVFCLKFGLFFERFVIIVTSIHQDYPSISLATPWLKSLLYVTIVLFIQGFIISIIILGIFEVLKMRKKD